MKGKGIKRGNHSKCLIILQQFVNEFGLCESLVTSSLDKTTIKEILNIIYEAKHTHHLSVTNILAPKIVSPHSNTP